MVKQTILIILAILMVLSIVSGFAYGLQYMKNKNEDEHYNAPPTYVYENIEVIYTFEHVEFYGIAEKVEVWEGVESSNAIERVKPLYVITFPNGRKISMHEGVRVRVQW